MPKPELKIRTRPCGADWMFWSTPKSPFVCYGTPHDCELPTWSSGDVWTCPECRVTWRATRESKRPIWMGDRTQTYDFLASTSKTEGKETEMTPNESAQDLLTAPINTSVMSETDYLNRVVERLNEIQKKGRVNNLGACIAMEAITELAAEIMNRIELANKWPHGWPGTENDPTKADWKRRALYWASMARASERRLADFQKAVGNAAGSVLKACGFSSWMAEE